MVHGTRSSSCSIQSQVSARDPGQSGKNGHGPALAAVKRSGARFRGCAPAAVISKPSRSLLAVEILHLPVVLSLAVDIRRGVYSPVVLSVAVVLSLSVVLSLAVSAEQHCEYHGTGP